MSAETHAETALTLRPQRVPLKGLPVTAFQHPLDRQATENLKKIRGFDWLVGKFIEYGFERIDYITHIGGGIRVGPRQMSKHYAMLRECCDVLDVPEPELYVMQGGVNAFTSGHNHPFIVLETGLLELMDDDDEVMAVIAHELGHIKCGHVLYKTMARGIKPVLEIIGGSVPMIGKFVGSGIEAGLLTWSRRSELSADRAALLVMQDARPCVSMLMKLAGGTERHVQWLDAEQFLNQARAYKEGLDQSTSDRLYRFIVNMRATHPFAVERARMLDEWVHSPEYNSILAGNYSNNNGGLVKASLCPNDKCGQPTTPGNMFCGECGTPLRTH
ncbi:MAG: M48 family metallopeptidase [Acidobacteria bacterium]|nr:M48 family metallopeptidase [Acidobacteriota bacterium]